MKKGFSLVEIMVVLAALAGVALLVTKLGKNSLNIQNESVTTNDYNDLVRDTHFFLNDLKSCQVSLKGVSFPINNLATPVDNVELWSSDSKGLERNKKILAKNEKFKSLTIENMILQIDDPGALNLIDGTTVKTTATFKVMILKNKSKMELSNIKHSLSLNFTYNAARKEGVILDCNPEMSIKNQARVWCGTISNPCGSESVNAIGIGKFYEGKFTGTFQPLSDITEKFCLAAKNHPANFKECD